MPVYSKIGYAAALAGTLFFSGCGRATMPVRETISRDAQEEALNKLRTYRKNGTLSAEKMEYMIGVANTVNNSNKMAAEDAYKRAVKECKTSDCAAQALTEYRNASGQFVRSQSAIQRMLREMEEERKQKSQ